MLKQMCLRPYTCPRCAVRQIAKRCHLRPFHASRRDYRDRSVLSLLEERGYVNQIAGDRNALDELLRTRKVGFYAGIDPTAPSLHLGHLLPFMVLFWLYHHGHRTVSLVGGATAKVGDPSGRLTSRVKTAESVTQSNFESMFAQVGSLWESAIRYGKRHNRHLTGVGEKELLNNAQWLDNLNVLQFLKTMGNGMRIGTMLGRDTVRTKMDKGDGMSFSEFTYPLLQAWDWWHMFRNKDVQVQIGGSDQYGNIIAGIDAVKYIAQSHTEADCNDQWLDSNGRLKDDMSPMGLTVPLLTTSSGAKFGKSAGNAVWLDRNLTSPFDLYGFLLRSGDDEVERYLMLFTFVPIVDITSTMEEHRADPGKRKAQHLLAKEVLELVHGPEEAAKTHAEHQAMRNPTLSSLARQPQSQPDSNAAEQPPAFAQRTHLPRSLVYGTPFSRILYHAGLVPTKSEGSRLIAKGGAYVADFGQHGKEQGLNFVPIRDQQATENTSLVKDGLLVLRLGKWKVRAIEVISDEEFDATGQEVPGWTEFKSGSRA